MPYLAHRSRSPQMYLSDGMSRPFVPVPEDMMEKAKLPALSYASALEGIAEKHHASPALLRNLNPGTHFDTAGEEILAPNVLVPPPAKAASSPSATRPTPDRRTTGWTRTRCGPS